MKLILTIIIFMALKLYEVTILPISKCIKWGCAVADWQMGFIDYFKYNICKLIVCILGFCVGLAIVYFWCFVWTATLYFLFYDYEWVYIFTLSIKAGPKIVEPQWLMGVGILSAIWLPVFLAIATVFRNDVYAWIKSNWEQAKKYSSKITGKE